MHGAWWPCEDCFQNSISRESSLAAVSGHQCGGAALLHRLLLALVGHGRARGLHGAHRVLMILGLKETVPLLFHIGVT